MPLNESQLMNFGHRAHDVSGFLAVLSAKDSARQGGWHSFRKQRRMDILGHFFMETWTIGFSPARGEGDRFNLCTIKAIPRVTIAPIRVYHGQKISVPIVRSQIS